MNKAPLAGSEFSELELGPPSCFFNNMVLMFMLLSQLSCSKLRGVKVRKPFLTARAGSFVHVPSHLTP